MTSRQAVNIIKAPVTWILVADGSNAHVYTRVVEDRRIPQGGNARRHLSAERLVSELVPVPGMELETESAHEMSDLPGDVREEVKLHFMQMIAQKLNEALAKKSFDKLVLIATPKMLGELRDCLAPAVKQCVVAEMPKDLTHCAGGEILQHLKDSGLGSA